MKKDYFNLKKSKLLLLMLLTMIVGASPAWAQKTLPYSYGFENNNLAGEGWTKVDKNGSSTLIPNNTAITSDSKRSGDRCFQFWYNTNPPQYLISPEVATSEVSLNLSFWYKNGSTYTETFNVGYSTTNSETESFTWLEVTDITAPSSWTEYTNTLPAGTKYVAIKYTANNQYKLWIDDFSVAEVEDYPKPKDFTFTGYTSTTTTFSWTNGGEETAWQIAYSTTQGFDAGAVTPVDVTTKPYTLEGLTAETTYYARIRANYGGGNYSKWTDEISFKPSAAINTIINNGSSTTPGYAFIPFHTNYTDGKIDKSQFIIPAASLSSMTSRQITKLTFHSYQASASFGTTVFKVYLKETDASAFDAATFDYSDMEEVYSGTVSISGNLMDITLDTPFDYGDGNLMVGFEMTTKGTAPSTYNWYGITADGYASIYSYLYGSGSATSGRSYFLPKMTITSLPQTSAPKMKVEAEASYDFKFLTSSSTTEDKTATFEVQNKGNAALTDANVSYSGDAAISLSATGTLASIAAKGSTEITITVNTETPGIYAGTITITGTGSEDVEIPVKAVVRNTDKLFIDFDENNPKPAAWTLGSGWSVNSTNSIATIGNTTAAITTSEILSAGETLTLRYRGNYDGDGAALAVSYCATIDGEYTDATETVSSIGYNVWKYATFTIPAAAKFVKITGKYIDIDAFYGLQAPAVPVVVLSTTSHDFGLVSNADTQALTLTISNEGGAALTGLSVTPSSGFAVTDMEGNALTTTTIAASSSLSVKVKVNAVGQQSGTVTISGTGVDEQVVNVSGYMLDDTKILETFAAQPKKWSFASGWTFNASTGAYSGTDSRKVVTPTLIVGASEVLALNVKLGWSGGSLIVEGSEDNGETWTAFDAKTYNSTNGGLNTSSYTLITIDDIPTTVNKLRLTGYYAYINVFNGFTYAVDPQLGLYTDEDCTVAAAAEVDKNFGFITSAQQQKYYIKNDWTGQIDLTVNTPTGFTATLDDNALTKDEKAMLTITIPADEGLHNDAIVVTAKNHANDVELGTFTVNANGAVAGSKNDINIVANELSEMPAGWDRGNWSMSASTYVYNSSSTSCDMTSQIFTVAEGETMLIEAKGVNSYNDASLSYSFKVGDADWTTPVAVTGISRSDWKVFELTGASEGQVKIKFTGAYVGIRRFYGFEAAAVPVMGFAAEGTTKNFGMITAKTTSDTYTITNSGTAALNGLSVACNNDNFEIAVADNATSIAAGGSVTFTVALKTTALGSQSGTVTIAGTGVESKIFTVKGYVADGTKIFTTFASLPDRWENSGWTFNSSTGAYGNSSTATLTSPKITVTSGDKLFISAKLQYSNSSYGLTVKGSTDNGSTWTYTNKVEGFNTTDYTVVELSDIPADVNKLQLVGYYVYVNGLNGFTYDENDPEFSMFSDSECNTPIAGTTATNNWGFVSEDKTATYYIKNTGTGTLSLSKSETPAGFTVELGATSLAAGKSTTLTISMANDAENNEGYHGGDVVLTGKNSSDETLGTFTVTSSGVVVGSKTDVNFASLSDFPAGWETTNWSVSSGKATVGYTSGTLTTGTYTVAEGESMIVEARKNSSSSYATIALSYSYSTDAGSTWSTAKTITPATTSYEMIAISDVPAGDVVIKFTGTYIDIQRIYGYTAVAKPAMALDKTADYDFGMLTDVSDPYVITVTNNGTAEMTGLKAELAKGEASDYTVAVSKTTLAVNETATVTVTQKFDASKGLASLSDVLTISADDVAAKTINLSGKTRDAAKWYVDFADGTIPASFVEQGSWSASSKYASTSSTESSLITQPINLAAGEKIQFEAKNPYSGSLKVRYSVNGGISWSEFVDYNSQLNSSSFTALQLDLQNTKAVTAIIEFCGRYYVQLDNIYGGTLNNEAPMIAVTEGTTAVASGDTKDFGSILAEATATYTIKNIGNGTLTITSPVATTGDATAEVSTTSLTAGQSATLTITMPVSAPYGAKSGEVTVETSLGNFVINYTATTMNPDALNVDFAGNSKPAGWYWGANGYWKVTGNEASQTDASTAEDLITEQLTVAGADDALTFQAARTSSNSTPTFKVYTSQDRVVWDEYDVSSTTLTTAYQDITISGLAAGDYYVKISGARIKVDNFLGWTKKNNTRDLYVTATTFPATTAKGNAATVTATVTSLIANETGVYAKLFVDGEDDAVLTAEAQDIELNASKTFSFSYEIPENKTAQIKVFYSDDAEAFATATADMKVSYSMSETDDSETITAGIFNVSLTRTFADDSWNTVCLPVAVASVADTFGENAAAYEFTGFNDQILSFSKVAALEAGTPYIIYVENAISSLSFTNAEVVATAGNVEQGTATFQGTYAPIADMSGKYGVTSKNTIAKGKSGSSIKGFRAYFEGDNLSNARINAIDESTGISRVFAADEVLGDQRVYNLNGQHVENAKKGVYIVNGKKVVIK